MTKSVPAKGGRSSSTASPRSPKRLLLRCVTSQQTGALRLKRGSSPRLRRMPRERTVAPQHLSNVPSRWPTRKVFGARSRCSTASGCRGWSAAPSPRTRPGPASPTRSSRICQYDAGRTDTGLAEPLTDRELMVLEHLPSMSSNAEIAEEMYVSVNTIKAHLEVPVSQAGGIEPQSGGPPSQRTELVRPQRQNHGSG